MFKIVKILGLLMFVFKLSIAQVDSLGRKEYKIFKYPNGNIASEGYIDNNYPTGFWKSYYITGVKKSEGVWKNNKLDSIWIFYDQLGDTIEKINYYLGKKNGYYYKFFKNHELKNRIALKELYVNGKRSGEANYLFGNGKLKQSIPYKNDREHGIGLEFNKDADIITITRYRNGEIIVQEMVNRYDKEGNKEGVWKEFYNNGNLKEEKTFLKGKLNGYVKRYNEEGRLIASYKYNNGEVDLSENSFDVNVQIKEEYNEDGDLIFQGSFKGETPIGIHRYFNASGKVIKSKTYNISGNLIAEGIVLPNGWENGEWTFFYENGKKQAIGAFNNGKKTGKWAYYYENGKVQQTGSFSAGKYTGIWKWYYETGELLREEYYIYGKQDGECIEYSVIGEIISKGNYIEGNKEGEWIYIIGDQKLQGKYIVGVRDGEWISNYIEEGAISFKGRYLQGSPDEKHVFYYPDGTIKEEQYYSEGEKVRSWTKYNKRGELVIVVQYKNGIPYKINGVKVKLNQDEI